MKKRGLGTRKIILAIFVALMIGVIILTGRRKMLMALSIFWVVQLFFYSVLRKGRSQIAVSLLILGLVVSTGIGFLGTSDSSVYLQRGSSVFSSVGSP